MQFWQEHGGGNPKHLSPLNLAFIGDAVYETMVRERLLLSGARPVGELHKAAVHYVCAQSQSAAYQALCGMLTEEETEILKRGRNASSSRTPKSSSVMEYRRATAVETLLGYLYLRGAQERLRELVDFIFGVLSPEAEKAQEAGID